MASLQGFEIPQAVDDDGWTLFVEQEKPEIVHVQEAVENTAENHQGAVGNYQQAFEDQHAAVENSEQAVKDDPEDDFEEEFEVFELPVVHDPIAYINREKAQVVSLLGIKYKEKAPDGILHRLNVLITWLETCTWAPSEIPKGARSGLKGLLQFMFTTENPKIVDRQVHFTKKMKARAEALHNRLFPVSEEVVDEVEEDDNVTQALEAAAQYQAPAAPVSRSRVAASASSAAAAHDSTVSTSRVLRLPSPDHPIFGDNGPMRGIAYTINGEGVRSWCVNPMYIHYRKSSNCFGHNDIPVGSIWGRQSAACFNGAHGSWFSGICGDTQRGAYSIVKSGTYGGLDKDYGDVLFYSGSGANKALNSTDPVVMSKGTKLLVTSCKTKEPIRVLRSSSNGGGEFCPEIGVRYDGLYIIHDMEVKTNSKGSVYFQFELHRLAGQTPLVDLLEIPNAAQKELFYQADRY